MKERIIQLENDVTKLKDFVFEMIDLIGAFEGDSDKWQSQLIAKYDEFFPKSK